jgi:predicted ATPase
MLHEFTVDNFKSLINVTFRPQEENLLLGANNSGKTNLCHAMCILAGSSEVPLDKVIEYFSWAASRITNVYFSKSTIDFHVRASVPFESQDLTFTYDLTVGIKAEQSLSPVIEVEHEFLRVNGDGFDGVTLVENTRNGVLLLHELDHLQGRENRVRTSAPRDATMLQRLYDLETNPRANCFKEYLRSWRYYDLSVEAMRGLEHQPNVRSLARNGGNLASVIHSLKTTDERKYRTLLSYLREIDPRIDVVNFFPAEEMIVMYFEDSKGNKLPASRASAGTLRFLALLYVLTVQPVTVPTPVLMIEEPENGLYVGMLKRLLEVMRDTPSRPQVIFTSHSPYFIDLFDDRLEGVFVMKRGEEHSSIVQPDVEKVKARLEKYPLGEMHFREMLV